LHFPFIEAIGVTAAFDKGYIGIKPDYSVMISSKLRKREKESYYNRFFSHLKGLKIKLPEKYYPNRKFLEYHLDSIFLG